MMTPLKQEYLQLVSLTKALLEQEFASQPPQLVDASTHQFFKQHASEQRPAPAAEKKIAPSVLLAPTQNKPAPPPPLNPSPKLPQDAPTPVVPMITPPQPPKPVPPVVEKSTASTRFQLEPLGAVEADAFAEVKRAVHQALPRLVLIDKPPNDAIARQIAQSWQDSFPNVVILSLQEVPEHQEFLAKLTQAIDQRLTHASVLDAKKLESCNDWNRLFEAKNLRLVLLKKSTLNALPGLKALSEATTPLPLLFLEEISLYLKDPSLKASLWKTLCDHLKPQP